jgi:hypothetical protein
VIAGQLVLKTVDGRQCHLRAVGGIPIWSHIGNFRHRSLAAAF